MKFKNWMWIIGFILILVLLVFFVNSVYIGWFNMDYFLDYFDDASINSTLWDTTVVSRVSCMVETETCGDDGRCYLYLVGCDTLPAQECGGNSEVANEMLYTVNDSSYNISFSWSALAQMEGCDGNNYWLGINLCENESILTNNCFYSDYKIGVITGKHIMTLGLGDWVLEYHNETKKWVVFYPNGTVTEFDSGIVNPRLYWDAVTSVNSIQELGTNLKIYNFSLIDYRGNISLEGSGIYPPDIVYLLDDVVLSVNASSIGWDGKDFLHDVWVDSDFKGGFDNYSMNGTTGVNFSFLIDHNNFTSGTTYTYRFFANNSKGFDVVDQFGMLYKGEVSLGDFTFIVYSNPPDAFNVSHFPESLSVGDSFYIAVELNDSNGDNLEYCNFTLTPPNGSNVVDNVNGSIDSVIFEPFDINWTLLGQVVDDSGLWSWNVSYQDNQSGFNSTNGSFLVANVNAPVVVVTFPVNNTDYAFSNIDLNFSAVDDVRVRDCWYEKDELENISLSSCGNVTIGLGLALYNITVYANDSSGNEGSSGFYNFSISADNTVPDISFFIVNGSLITSSSISINVSVSDNGALDSCWYDFFAGGVTPEFRSGVENTSVTCGSSISKSVSDGVFYYIRYYANDSVNNEGFAEISYLGSITIPPPPSGGGGGAPPVEAIIPLSCGDDICSPENGETPWNCARDCATLARLRTGELFDIPFIANMIYALGILALLALLPGDTYEGIFRWFRWKFEGLRHGFGRFFDRFF